MQNKNLNFPAHYVSAKIKTNQKILSFHTALLQLLNGGKIKILILHGKKANKSSSHSLSCKICNFGSQNIYSALQIFLRYSVLLTAAGA